MMSYYLVTEGASGANVVVLAKNIPAARRAALRYFERTEAAGMFTLEDLHAEPIEVIS